jgi:hypothetical protein
LLDCPNAEAAININATLPIASARIVAPNSCWQFTGYSQFGKSVDRAGAAGRGLHCDKR